MKSQIDGGIRRSDASRQLGMPLRTVQRWLSFGVFPERKERKLPSRVDTFGDYLDKRYRDGCSKVSTHDA
jgi:hypothetical protein